MPSTGEDELVNSLPFCSGTRTGFKYEWADLPQLTEVPTHSTTAAEILPPAPGSRFSEQQFRKCIFITFKQPNELKHKTPELQRKQQTPVGRALIRCICIVLRAPLSGSILLCGRLWKPNICALKGSSCFPSPPASEQSFTFRALRSQEHTSLTPAEGERISLLLS